MTIDPVLQILSSEPSAPSDGGLGRFADFLGLRAEVVTLRSETDASAPVPIAGSAGARAIALSFSTLRTFTGRSWFDQLVENAPFLLVYGFSPETGESPELKQLTAGALSGIATLPARERRFNVHDNLPGGPYPVSGMSYTIAAAAQPVFVAGTGFGAARVHVSAEKDPYFVSVPRGRGAVFLLAEEALVDIDTPLTPHSAIRAWFAQLVSLSVFFRGIFGSYCWTAPTVGANLIVDDPYLKKRYGFIRYEALLAELRRTGSALTVAFIPFNHRRSDSGVVRLLRSAPGNFSIAIHGCDHGPAEYSSTDGAWLEGTSACAIDRMERHQSRTGMPFDKVMVFPQGRYSIEAAGALKNCGFAAGVNTTNWAVDWAKAPLALRDFLDVAVVRYERFPIFLRHFPDDVFGYAFYALFQKPVLAEAHHQFFEDGFGLLETFVRNVARISPAPKWMPLGSAILSSHLVRRDSEGRWSLRHYVPEFRHRNLAGSDLAFAVEKPESDGSVEAVLVDGKPVPFEVQSGWLRYSAAARAGEEVAARVIYRPHPRQPRRPTLKYSLGVSSRRWLSNVRDNYLVRNKRILRVAELLLKKHRVGPLYGAQKKP
ncbi:MAG: hypothetical protein ABSA05_16825 [Opitutaceae bacterium]|jgi:hypothetical protein